MQVQKDRFGTNQRALKHQLKEASKRKKWTANFVGLHEKADSHSPREENESKRRKNNKRPGHCFSQEFIRLCQIIIY